MLAMMMAGALTIPAYAVNITIRDNSPISTYAVERSYNGYKLLNLTTSKNDDNTVNYAYTMNDKYLEVLQYQVYVKASDEFWTKNGGTKPKAAGDVTDAQILEYLGTLTSDAGNNPGTMRTFADALYRAIVTANLEADAKAHNATFNDVAQGYWLIADVTDLGEDSKEANSLVVVDTKGQEDLVVTPKTSVPTVDKKVQDKNDSTGNTSDWQDGADYDIGDDVPFQLTGTMPGNIASYTRYKYVFHDNLSDGLTLNENTIKVMVGTTELTKDTHYTVNTAATDGCDFEIVIGDLLDITGLDITKDSTVVVTYTAKLNDKAVTNDSGNTNKVKLEFSNNPYDDGEGEPSTSETPEDTVTVFTFKLDVDKVAVDKTTPIPGAGFTLYKYDSVTQTYVQVGDELKAAEGGTMTNFTWTGLDSGKYKLVETTVPNGYNKADDIEFTIVATYTTDGATQSVTDLVVKDADGKETISGTDLTFTATPADGTVATDIVNTTGVELPSTGGMGTTIFYVLGGLLTVGAAVLMVTKKRMSNGSED